MKFDNDLDTNELETLMRLDYLCKSNYFKGFFSLCM